MAPIWNGIARWLRFRWYLTKWADRNKMPFDVRQRILRSAVARFRKERPTMSPEERQKAAVQMLSAVFGTDTPMDTETQDELVAEAMKMLSEGQPASQAKVPPGMYLDPCLPEEWTEKDLAKLKSPHLKEKG